MRGETVLFYFYLGLIFIFHFSLSLFFINSFSGLGSFDINEIISEKNEGSLQFNIFDNSSGEEADFEKFSENITEELNESGLVAFTQVATNNISDLNTENYTDNYNMNAQLYHPVQAPSYNYCEVYSNMNPPVITAVDFTDYNPAKSACYNNYNPVTATGYSTDLTVYTRSRWHGCEKTKKKNERMKRDPKSYRPYIQRNNKERDGWKYWDSTTNDADIARRMQWKRLWHHLEECSNFSMSWGKYVYSINYLASADYMSLDYLNGSL